MKGSLSHLLIGRLPRYFPSSVEYFMRATFSKLGKPFNGQERRIEIVGELMRSFSFSAVVETGANLGASTTWIAERAGCPIYTCELDPRRANFCKYRLRKFNNVHVLCGNSAELLRWRVIDLAQGLGGASFFYLDAHWYDHLPLAEELAAIAEAKLAAVVMVDDFEVPGDAGYGYDDYGPGKRLCLAYLQKAIPTLEMVFFPIATSGNETGAKRGCVVFGTTAGLSEALRRVPSLRPFSKAGGDHVVEAAAD